MPKRDPKNYPPYRKGFSCHHVAYPYKAYQGPTEHGLYQYDTALLLSVPNVRHNIGYLALHNLLPPPPKPNFYLMNQAIEFMEWQDKGVPRIDRFAEVIDFYEEVAGTHYKPSIAEQAGKIATHYAMQHFIITHGGEAFVKGQQWNVA